jgi:hypothetical protein
MGLLVLESIGPRSEELANQAGETLGVPVGIDPEFESATFDSDDLDDDSLQAAVFEALDEADSEWRSHLRVAE